MCYINKVHMDLFNVYHRTCNFHNYEEYLIVFININSIIIIIIIISIMERNRIYCFKGYLREFKGFHFE